MMRRPSAGSRACPTNAPVDRRMVLREARVALAAATSEGSQVLARALKCHPAVLVFPGWETESAA